MNKNALSAIFSACLLSVLLLVSACKSTKYVPSGSYLLQKNTIILDDKKKITSDEILPYIRQKANRSSLFGIKFFLNQYNLSGADTTKWLNKKLKYWGEPPVIFDSSMLVYSLNNIKSYMNERGYYYANVRDSLVIKDKKVEVVYKIETNKTYNFNQINYTTLDTNIQELILKDSANSVLRTRKFLSLAALEAEQERITKLIRNNGYYAFNKSYVSFELDTLKERMLVDVEIIIADYKRATDTRTSIHPKFKIRQVFVYTSYDALKVIADSNYINNFDTIYQNNMYIIFNEQMKLNANVLSRVNLIYPNSYFKEDHVSMTHNNIANLNVFKTINIIFKSTNKQDENGNLLLDCIIQLDPLVQQSYKLDFELSTNASELIGFSPGFRYAHANFMGGAEALSLDFRGIFQYTLPTAKQYQNSFEYNATASINLPQFLMPFFQVPYFRQHVPHTKLTTVYVYQNRPDYTRSKINASLSYIWKGSPQNTFIITPLDFSMIKIWDLSEDFYNNIKDPFLQSIYVSHFNLGLEASYIYNSQGAKQNKTRPSSYFRASTNFAGNTLSLFNSLLPKNQDEFGEYHTIFDVPYTQYAKFDINYVYNKPVQAINAIAYRAYFGLGRAYGNALTLPLEKMFYSGGANSLRGWPVRGVGPGSAVRDSSLAIPSQVGDLKIEMNVEYRFSIFWFFEGALFADAGNIWSITPLDDRKEAKFRFNSFYKEIATSIGTGLRLNFSYFIVRFDLGMRLYDPAKPEGSRLIKPNYWLSKDNKSFHFGINYPF